MQKIVFLFLLFFYGTGAFCQQQYFVYIQSDELQPFYAKINSKIYSSSEKGYMIIPKLEDKAYELTIGFAKNQILEQRFSIDLNNKDQGFQLKNFGDKGWGLFNLQTMAVSMNAGSTEKSTEDIAGVKKTDAFSELLANVVNDSAILYSSAKPKPVEAAQKDIVKTKQNGVQNSDTISGRTDNSVVVEPAVKKDSSLADQKQEVAQNDPKKDSTLGLPDQSAEPAKKEVKEAQFNTKTPEKPFILKIKEESTDNLYTAIYLEQYNYTTDTIRISIPLKEQPVNPTPVATEKTSDEKTGKEDKAASSTSIVTDTAVSKKTAVVIFNSDCKKIASEYDVDKIRVKLLDNKSVDDKINTAKKYFKSKCLTVKQIMALSELFPMDEAKLRFFEAAYPFVSDTGNFILLEEMLGNEIYRTRFKDMIHK